MVHMLTDHCIVTNNPCGTDTRLRGTMCACAPCMRWASETIEQLTKERDGARAVAVRYWRRYRRHFNAIGHEDLNEDAIVSSWDHRV